MARLIDANALMEQVKAIHKAVDASAINTDYDTGFHSATSQVQGLIAYMPTVDAVEVVHGHWEWLGPNGLVSECMCGTCSACKVRSKYIVNTDICPNCGAKMDGERSDGK